MLMVLGRTRRPGCRRATARPAPVGSTAPARARRPSCRACSSSCACSCSWSEPPPGTAPRALRPLAVVSSPGATLRAPRPVQPPAGASMAESRRRGGGRGDTGGGVTGEVSPAGRHRRWWCFFGVGGGGVTGATAGATGGALAGATGGVGVAVGAGVAGAGGDLAGAVGTGVGVAARRGRRRLCRGEARWSASRAARARPRRHCRSSAIVDDLVVSLSSFVV